MYTRYTRWFRSALHRSDHFQSHGARLGFLGDAEYEAFADEFLGEPAPVGAREFTRPWNGDLVRYDEASEVFAILDCDGFIKTCYRPDPTIHGEPINLAYYRAEEGKA